MGVWDFIKKMATGKPVFENQPPQHDADHAGWVDHIATTPATNPSPFVNEQGSKIIPQVTMEHCKSHIDGANMNVTAWVTNRSQFEIELDKIVMIDTKTELDRRLQSQEGHEVTLYRGPQPANDRANKAQLYYKIVQNGDNFCADFMIEYNLESTGMFTVEDLHPDQHMVHDV